MGWLFMWAHALIVMPITRELRVRASCLTAPLFHVFGNQVVALLLVPAHVHSSLGYSLREFELLVIAVMMAICFARSFLGPSPKAFVDSNLDTCRMHAIRNYAHSQPRP